jgi:hypothetical protein
MYLEFGPDISLKEQCALFVDFHVSVTAQPGAVKHTKNKDILILIFLSSRICHLEKNNFKSFGEKKVIP